MPKYGGIGGQGAAVFLEATEDVTLKQIWKKNPSKRISAGKPTKRCRLLNRDHQLILQETAKTAIKPES